MILGFNSHLNQIIAAKDQLVNLTREAFVPFANAHTWVLWTLLAAFAERIRTANDEMVDLAFRDVPYRLLRALNQLVQRHGEATLSNVFPSVNYAPLGLIAQATS